MTTGSIRLRRVGHACEHVIAAPRLVEARLRCDDSDWPLHSVMHNTYINKLLIIIIIIIRREDDNNCRYYCYHVYLVLFKFHSLPNPLTSSYTYIHTRFMS